MSCFTAFGELRGKLHTASGTIEDIHRAFGELRGKLHTASGKVVCAVSDTSFLRVTPTEVQWITDYTSATFEVRSNVDWEIE